MGTKQEPGKFDVKYENIPDNMQHMIFLSSDPLAPHIAEVYAHWYLRDWTSAFEAFLKGVATAGTILRHSQDKDAKANEALSMAEAFREQAKEYGEEYLRKAYRLRQQNLNRVHGVTGEDKKIPM